MRTFAQSQNLRACDVIVTPKSDFHIVEHYVVYMGVNKIGQEIYFENNHIEGVRAITGEQFAALNPVAIRVNRFLGTDQQRLSAFYRAKLLLGTKYDLANFNCEHYANHVQHAVPYSRQAQNGFGLAMAASIIGLALLISKS